MQCMRLKSDPSLLTIIKASGVNGVQVSTSELQRPRAQVRSDCRLSVPCGELFRSKCASENESKREDAFLWRGPAIFALFVMNQEGVGVGQLMKAVWTLLAWVLLGPANTSEQNSHPLPPVYQFRLGSQTLV